MASRAIPAPPPDAVGLRLHQALSQPLPTAPWDFASAYLPHLVAWLQAKNQRVPPDLCEDAALETVYSLLSRPQQYQPAKGKKLLTYLRMSAQRDLINLLQRERRHQHQPFDEQRVELPSAGGNYEGKDRE